MRKKIWWLDAIRIETIKVIGRRKQSFETRGRRLIFRQGNAARRSLKKAVKPAKVRDLVDYLQGTFQVSIRHGCRLIGLNKSSYFYKSRRLSQAGLRKRIREIAETRVRYGYRRIHILLRREGRGVNANGVYRLYVEEGLQIRNKRPKRKVSAKLREDRRPPQGPNDVWAMGPYVLQLPTSNRLSDELFDGRKIRVLAIIDAFTTLSPAIDVRMRYTGANVVSTLERVCKEYVLPKSIRVDNGPEFISKDLDLWDYDGVILDFSRPGKPTDNSFVESFNGQVRAECIDQNWFLSLSDVQVKCEAFRHDYNYVRPHSSIQHKTPMEFIKSLETSCHHKVLKGQIPN